MTTFNCKLCEREITNVWRVGKYLYCTECYKMIKNDIYHGRCRICPKCGSITYDRVTSFTIDGLEFKSGICYDCKIEFDKKVTAIFSDYGFKPDDDELWLDTDV